MKSNDQYMSLYDYSGKASRESGLGQKVYEAAKSKNIHVIYQDLPPDLSRPEYNRVATYPKSFLDEYFGKTTPGDTFASELAQADLRYLLERLYSLENKFDELIKKLDTNVTNSVESVDDDLPF
jgi:hypothetical protein